MGRQRIHGDVGALALHDQAALHDVAQFAHVARPAVSLQRLDGLGGEGRARHLEHRGKLPVEIIHQRRDVGGAPPQLRQADLHKAQTVVQVAAELLLGDQTLDVLVRRGDHAHVERLRGVRSQLRDALLLQHAQQAHLHVHRHLADLVEEQRAAVRELELPHRARLARPGERPALVAEQLGGQQVARQGAAVDGHELAGASAATMQRAGHHFLAGARLAQQQHVRLDGRDLLHHAVDLLPLLGFPDVVHLVAGRHDCGVAAPAGCAAGVALGFVAVFEHEHDERLLSFDLHLAVPHEVELVHRARAPLLESDGQRCLQLVRQIEHVLHGEVLSQIGAERLRAVRILLPARAICAHARVAAQDAAVGVDQKHRVLVGQHKRFEEVDRGQQSARLRTGAMQVVRQRDADAAQLERALRQDGERAVDVHRAVVLSRGIEVANMFARWRDNARTRRRAPASSRRPPGWRCRCPPPLRA